MKTKAENLLFWEQRIRDRVQSGSTVGEWCNKNGVSKHQYNYWNRQVRKNQETGGDMLFADIAPVLSAVDPERKNPGFTSDFQVFFKDIQITVPDNFNPSALAGLMKVLQEL